MRRVLALSFCYRRTQLTIFPGADPEALAEKILTSHRGEMVVVGQTHTVPSVINSLGGHKAPYILSSVYDNLFIVTISSDRQANVVQIKYGRIGGATTVKPHD